MAHDLAGISVLILDDQKNMRALWRSIMLGFGVRDVYEAADAGAAFEILRGREVDVAIVDMLLDDLDGDGFVRMVRRSPQSPCVTLPIIACTAHTRLTMIKKLIDAGVDEVLTKPVSVESAWQKLVAIVNHRRVFVHSPNFVGPDRRRRADPDFEGPFRRAADNAEQEMFDIS